MCVSSNMTCACVVAATFSHGMAVHDSVALHVAVFWHRYALRDACRTLTLSWVVEMVEMSRWLRIGPCGAGQTLVHDAGVMSPSKSASLVVRMHVQLHLCMHVCMYACMYVCTSRAHLPVSGARQPHATCVCWSSRQCPPILIENIIV